MSEAADRPVPQHLRTVAYAEGATLLLLVFIGMPLKYGFGITTANAVLGPLHGVVFLAYAAILLWVAWRERRSIDWLIQAGIASLLPGGTFWFFAPPGKQPGAA